MDIIAYCDGSNTIFDLSIMTSIPLKKVVSELLILSSHNIIKFED